jgi:ribosomal protein S27AE
MRAPDGRKKIFRDNLGAQVHLRQLRAAYPVRAWDTIDSVPVEGGGAKAFVKIIRIPQTNIFGGVRSWLVCPNCEKKTFTLGVAHGEDGQPRWACKRCTKWTTRDAPKELTELTEQTAQLFPDQT